MATNTTREADIRAALDHSGPLEPNHLTSQGAVRS